MNLPFFNKKPKTEYFLALLLREEKVNAVIFEENLGKVHVVGNHHEYFETSIEDASVEEFLEVLDKAISQAENSLPPNVETQKTVFGVKDTWVENAKIKREYLITLKKICDALGLRPIGFLVIHEAIAHSLEQQEGAPVSAILVEVDKKTLSISLIRAGKIIGTKSDAIEESVPKTADKLLNTFKEYEILPSRIIVFDGDDPEKLSQKFLNHSWSKSLPFLHLPQITPLPAGFDARAVLEGAALQMGFELPTEEEEKISPIPHIEDLGKRKETQTKEEQSVKHNIKQNKSEEENQVLDNNKNENSFGFIKDKDVAMTTSDISEEKIPETAEHDDQTSLKDHKEHQVDMIHDNIVPIKQEQPEEYTNYKSPLLPVLSFGGLTKIARTSFVHVEKLFPHGNGMKKVYMIFPLFLLGLLAITMLYIFGLRATITVLISPKVVSENKQVVFSQTDDTNIKGSIISSESITVEEDGEISKPTTGTKEVGEKAKGTVTLYSRFSSPKTLDESTVLTGPNSLKFSLDKSVNIASSSADASSPPTTTNVSVTATNVGKEYNLPSNTKLTVADMAAATIVAKNDTAFSGGSKKEILVVSKDDVKKLEEDIVKNLESRARSNIIKKVPSGKTLLPIALQSEITKETFNKKAGEEAKTLTLNAKVTYQSLMYTQKDMDDFAREAIKDQSSDTLAPSEQGIEIEASDAVIEKDKKAKATIKIKASLLPKIDKKTLAKNVSGKSFEQTESILSEIPQVNSVHISLFPPFGFLPKFLPRVSDNISFSIKNE